MRNPRIVFVPDAPIELTTANFKKFNADEKKTQSKTEKAKAQSKTLNDVVVLKIADFLKDVDNLSEIYGNANKTGELLSLLVSEGVILPSEVAQLRNENGTLTGAGRDMFEALMLGSAFDAKDIQRIMSFSEVQKAVIFKAIPRIIENKTLGKFNITDYLSEAIEIVSSANKAGTSVEIEGRQIDLLKGAHSNQAINLALALAIDDKRETGKLRKIFEDYNNSIREEAQGTDSLFEKREASAVLTDVLKLHGFSKVFISRNVFIEKGDAAVSVSERADGTAGAASGATFRVSESGESRGKQEKAEKSNEVEQIDDVNDPNRLVKMAREGNVAAQKKLSEFGLEWEKTPVRRFVSKSEIDALLKGEHIDGRNKDAGVDVTTSETVTSAMNADYVVEFKDGNRYDDKMDGSDVVIKDKESGDGWLRGGYDLSDVERITDKNGNMIYEASDKSGKVEAEKSRDKTSKVEGGRASSENQNEIKPVGRGAFGNIYDQFRGKAKEAIAFLANKKEGDAVGVFHRNELGDIDMVWGSAENKQGIEHIIDKHSEKKNDFNSIEDAASVIDDVIRNGTITKDKADKATIEKDGYKVVVSKNVRDTQGNILQTKNWVVTAFDITRTEGEKKNASSKSELYTADKTDAAAGQTTPTNDSVFGGKGTNKNSEKQEKGKKLSRGEEQMLDRMKRITEFVARFNVKIDIRRDSYYEEHPPSNPRLRTEKGWYNPKTGQIVVNIDRSTSYEDAIETVLHEAVGHHGMRQIVGAERYDAFLRELYDKADGKIQESIKERMRQGASFAEAMDEYLAELAEKVKFDSAEKSLWEKVLSFFHDLFGINITDRQLSDLLKKSYKNLLSGSNEVSTDGTNGGVARFRSALGEGSQGMAEQGYYDFDVSGLDVATADNMQ
ncbi:MAG: hypothetical protein LBD53_04745, partial [Tannerella sp.]|nr:hypothetical protein [Tannerella sp.]